MHLEKQMFHRPGQKTDSYEAVRLIGSSPRRQPTWELHGMLEFLGLGIRTRDPFLPPQSQARYRAAARWKSRGTVADNISLVARNEMSSIDILQVTRWFLPQVGKPRVYFELLHWL